MLPRLLHVHIVYHDISRTCMCVPIPPYPSPILILMFDESTQIRKLFWISICTYELFVFGCSMLLQPPKKVSIVLGLLDVQFALSVGCCSVSPRRCYIGFSGCPPTKTAPWGDQKSTMPGDATVCGFCMVLHTINLTHSLQLASVSNVNAMLLDLKAVVLAVSTEYLHHKCLGSLSFWRSLNGKSVTSIDLNINLNRFKALT